MTTRPPPPTSRIARALGAGAWTLAAALAPAQAQDAPDPGLACALEAATASAAADRGVAGAHALSIHGDVKYGPDFAHFDYADPDAPKGGAVTLAAIGTYDSFNGFILKGVPAASLGLIYDTLMIGAEDEPFTEYGLLAESVDMPEDRSWVEFALRPEARWHDGAPVTADDVVWTFETLREKGHPFFRQYYADVESVASPAPGRVRFAFSDTTNRELPLIVGQLTVLPRHYWEARDFEETTLEPPPGSGPYRIAEFDAGRSITYERAPDYWGRGLPVNRGRNNFDRVRFDYYRDNTIALEAFKAGEIDFRVENNSKDWATQYDFPARAEGHVVVDEVGHEIGTGMQGFWFNTRKDKFADARVRDALAHAFDFEWTNENLFYGQYARTESFYSNTELAASGRPEGLEAEILECFRGRLPEAAFGAPLAPPSTAGGSIRANLRKARGLLEEAGWAVRGGALVREATGAPMEIEFLLVSPAFERVIGPYAKNLERLGVAARIRTVDSAQYQKRVEDFDFDMIVASIGQSQSPGNEQRNQWSSAAADIPGSQNYAGIEDPVVDALVDLVIQAPSRAALVAATRALDRALLQGRYLVPNWHIRSFRLAYWNKFGRPAQPPRYGLGFPGLWWIDAALEERLSAAR